MVIVKAVGLGSPGACVGPEALRSLWVSFLSLDCNSKSSIFACSAWFYKGQVSCSVLNLWLPGSSSNLNKNRSCSV